ncbi:hypothetical protein BGX38DRAFT_1100290 [Terfezia claveryi]|nr:hypothetical protein BGX38DRAFT_1100290 [Terfezia claveryi]
MPPGVIPNAILGGIPDQKTDIPVCGVLIALFAINGFIHSHIFKQNKAQGRLFIFSMMVFGFCMSRCVTFGVRISWASSPTDPSLTIAAQVLLSAGVLLLFIVNLVCAQRILEALHPATGRSRSVRYSFMAYYASIIAALIMVITTTVQSFKTTNPSILKIDMDIRKFCGTWMTLFAFSPIPVSLIAFFTPGGSPPTKLGTGSMSTKVAMVCGVSVLLTLSVAFRTSIVFLPTRPITDTAWYYQRPAFYTFTPMLELMVVITLAALRFDQRFYLDGKAEKEEREQGMDMSTEDK